MAKQLFSNNATTTLSANITNVATSISVVTGKGALFNAPTGGDYELLTITDGTNYEVVKCTARSTDTLTVTRAQESTSARAWSAGATIAGYVTKGSLTYLRDHPGGGSDSVQIGTSASSGGTRSVSVGYSTVGSGLSCVSVGDNAESTANYATSIGVNSAASAAGGIAIGDTANVANQFGISMGTNSKVTGDYSVSIGYLTNNPVGQTPAAWASNTAYTDGNIRTIGPGDIRCECVRAGTSGSSYPTDVDSINNGDAFADNTVVWIRASLPATSSNSVIVGAQSFTDSGSIAVGVNAVGYNYGAIAVGSGSRATQNSIIVGNNCKANHDGVTLIGPSVQSLCPDSTYIGRLPFMGAAPNWWPGDEYQEYCAVDGYLNSEPFDLTGGSTWTATTAVKHGYAVKPTTPNGCQYTRFDYAYDTYRTRRIDLYSASNTGSSEPTWPTTFGDDVHDGTGDWICIPHDGTYVMNLPTDAYMMVSEVGFIAYDVSSVTGQPYISIGTGGADLTSLVNNQQTSGLTTSNTVYRWALTQPKLVQTLSIKIDTLATGTRLLGRFYFKGVLTRHWV